VNGEAVLEMTQARIADDGNAHVRRGTFRTAGSIWRMHDLPRESEGTNDNLFNNDDGGRVGMVHVRQCGGWRSRHVIITSITVLTY
jgi:hypothetical protein